MTVKVWPSTTWIDPDEPCFNLSELNGLGPGGGPFHRWQILVVVRDDRLAEHRTDMGPATAFEYPEFRIPGGGMEDDGHIWIVHTVNELREIANQLRHRSYEPTVAPPDLVDRYYKFMDEAKKLRRQSSTFGPLVTVVRNF